MKEKIIINPKLSNYLYNEFDNEINSSNLDYIFKGEYYNFNNENSITKISSIFDSDYSYIILFLALGYSFEEMLINFPKIIKKDEIDKFKKEMDNKNISIDQIVSLNRYCYGYDVIISYLKRKSKNDIFKRIIKSFKIRLKKIGCENKDIKLLLNYIVSLDYNEPLYSNINKLITFIKNMRYMDDLFIISKNLLKKIDLFYNLDDTVDNLYSCLKFDLPNSMILYKTFKSEDINIIIKRLLKSSKIIPFEGGVFTSASIDLNSLLELNDNDVIFNFFVPKGTKGVLLAPFSNTDSKEVLLDEYEFYVFEVETKNKKVYVKGILLSKDKSGYKKIDEIESNDIEEEYEYRKEVNRLIVMGKEDEELISTFTINGNNVKHTLEKNNRNKRELLLQKQFSLNSKDESLEQYIIDFSRRMPIYNIISSNNNIIIDGNDSIMKINNVDDVFASQIKKIVPQISSDLYFKKRMQEEMLRKKGNPLFFLSVRNISGKVNIIVISLISMVVAIIIIIALFTLNK